VCRCIVECQGKCTIWRNRARATPAVLVAERAVRYPAAHPPGFGGIGCEENLMSLLQFMLVILVLLAAVAVELEALDVNRLL
jgi:hypothetical protein